MAVNNPKVDFTQRQILESKYGKSRHNILLILVFTVINVVLLVTNSNSYFLFSAYIPYMLADLGMLFTGSYPKEYYMEMEIYGYDFHGKGFLWAMLAAGAVVLAVYLLCWIFSKKNRMGWMIAALVLFCFDTILFVHMLGFSTDLILDYVFHGWVIVSLAMGISAGSKLKKLPEEPETPVLETISAEEPSEEE